MSAKISHSGIVESVSERCVKVRILQTSACAACKVASHCNASESKVKIVDVLNVPEATSLKVGDSVVVSASRDVANRALLLGFGVPFVVMIAVLLIVLRVTGNEGLAALSGVLALVPYYLLVWVFRNSIQRQISFAIESINN